jgi:hypothetical protein
MHKSIGGLFLLVKGYLGYVNGNRRLTIPANRYSFPPDILKVKMVRNAG